MASWFAPCEILSYYGPAYPSDLPRIDTRLSKFCPNCGRLIESNFRRDLSECVNVTIEKEINEREKVNL
jgi:hypothetical protein